MKKEREREGEGRRISHHRYQVWKSLEGKMKEIPTPLLFLPNHSTFGGRGGNRERITS